MQTSCSVAQSCSYRHGVCSEKLVECTCYRRGDTRVSYHRRERDPMITLLFTVIVITIKREQNERTTELSALVTIRTKRNTVFVLVVTCPLARNLLNTSNSTGQQHP